MKPLKKLGLLTLALTLAVSLQACSGGKSAQTEAEHVVDEHAGHGGQAHRHGPGQVPHVHAGEAADAGFVQIRDHRFKLAPEIGKDHVAHLDLYVQDAHGQHVTGATITLNLTTPAQEKETFQLKEGENHYHTKAKLPQVGEYQAVAQVAIGEEKFNPRFNFQHP